jgi:hypothetical protein
MIATITPEFRVSDFPPSLDEAESRNLERLDERLQIVRDRTRAVAEG